MSLALSTWQSVLSFATEYYTPQLPLYYSERHTRILLDMIGTALGLRSFRVAFVDVPMPEPITCLETAVIVSRPLVGYYLNQPTRLPSDPIGFVSNVDLLADMLAEQPRERVDLSGRRVSNDRTGQPYGSLPLRCLAERSRLPQSVATYDPFAAAGRGDRDVVNDDDDGGVDTGRTSTSRPTLPRDSRLSDDDTVRVQHLLRMALMVAHWDQHRRRGIPYGTHAGFEDIEGLEDGNGQTSGTASLSTAAALEANSSVTLSIEDAPARVGRVTTLRDAEQAMAEQRAAKRRRRSPLAIAQSSLAYS